MKIFRLQKWYFDYLVPDQVYMFIYFAKINLFGYSESVLHLFVRLFAQKKKISRTVQLSSTTDSLQIDRDRIKSTALALGCGERTNTLKITLPGIDVDLLFKPLEFTAHRNCSLAIKAGRRSQQITWRPLHLKSEVSGKLRIGSFENRPGNASGYIDQLLSDVFPLNAPVHRLYWGRIHHPLINVVYTLSYGKKAGQQWHCILIHYNGAVVPCRDPDIRFGGGKYSDRLSVTYPESVEICAKQTQVMLKVTIHQKEIVSTSDFIGENDCNSLLKTRFLKYISKNPRGMKFLSSADVEMTYKHQKTSFRHLPCISEVVHFN